MREHPLGRLFAQAYTTRETDAGRDRVWSDYLAVRALLGLPDLEGDGCDCTELCSMGPTCPGGMLAGLPDSGCWRAASPAAGAASDGGAG